MTNFVVLVIAAIVGGIAIVLQAQFMEVMGKDIGALIDHFGLLRAEIRPLDISRLGGVLVLLIGVWLIIR